MPYPSTSINFNANTVPTILVLAWISFIFIHISNSASGEFSVIIDTFWFGITGVISLILGIILFIFISDN